MRLIMALGCALSVAGCASSPDPQEREAVTYEIQKRQVTCVKPPAKPTQTQVYSMLRKYGMDPEETLRRIKSDSEATYNREVMHYRLCTDLANGLIDESTYRRNLEKLMGEIAPLTYLDYTSDQAPSSGPNNAHDAPDAVRREASSGQPMIW